MIETPRLRFKFGKEELKKSIECGYTIQLLFGYYCLEREGGYLYVSVPDKIFPVRNGLAFDLLRSMYELNLINE